MAGPITCHNANCKGRGRRRIRITGRKVMVCTPCYNKLRRAAMDDLRQRALAAAGVVARDIR